MAAGDLVEELLAHALSYPGAWEDHPWGERVAKVGKKVFAFFGTGDGSRPPAVSVKLAAGAPDALDYPFCEPTGYGLGKSGWVTVTLRGRGRIPKRLVHDFIDHSYRNVAPKKRIAELDAREPD